MSQETDLKRKYTRLAKGFTEKLLRTFRRVDATES